MGRRLSILLALLWALLTLETAAASDLPTLMAQCAPKVHPATLSRIIRQESRGQLFALSDDGPSHLPWSQRKGMLRSFYPASQSEASAIVKTLTGNGHIVGIGLTQINSRHLPKLGLRVEDVLDPCTNLRVGADVLVRFYVSALERFGDPQRALVAAISAYNTGDFVAGINNGYVNKVLAREGGQVPALVAGKGGRKRGAASLSLAASPRPAATNALLAAKFATLEVEKF